MCNCGNNNWDWDFDNWDSIFEDARLIGLLPVFSGNRSDRDNDNDNDNDNDCRRCRCHHECCRRCYR